jgi:hypothetical protein
MHLSRIPDIAEHADTLAGAGLTTAAELAAITDLEALSQRTSMDRATLAGLQAAARAHLEGMLEEAGVRGLDDLAEADLDALSARSGIPRANLETLQDAARAKLGLPPAPRAAAPALPDRVVLMDGRASARVHLQGVERAGLAIVTLRMDEDEAAVLARAPGDAVLLRERAVTAPVRLDGVVHRDLPIYKERPVAQGEGREEIRVRVTEIKDRKGQAHGAPAQAAGGVAPEGAASESTRKKGFRLFGRGK